MLSHLAKAHRKRPAYYGFPPLEIRGTKSLAVGEPESLMDDVRAEMKKGPWISLLEGLTRVRRHPERDLVALTIFETPKRKARSPKELYQWLYPLCLRIAKAETPEEGLTALPKRLGLRGKFILRQVDRLRQTLKLSRYRRLKGPEAKARFLAKVFANPARAPSYAEQRFP